jgi:hypothetical protein
MNLLCNVANIMATIEVIHAASISPLLLVLLSTAPAFAPVLLLSLAFAPKYCSRVRLLLQSTDPESGFCS